MSNSNFLEDPIVYNGLVHKGPISPDTWMGLINKIIANEIVHLFSFKKTLKFMLKKIKSLKKFFKKNKKKETKAIIVKKSEEKDYGIKQR